MVDIKSHVESLRLIRPGVEAMRLIILWLLWFSLTGCVGLGHREGDLKVSISSLAILESTLMEQRYLVKLRLQNRTPNSLHIKGMSFDVEFNGKEFASGVSNRQTHVAAFDEASIQVVMVSSLFDIIRQLQLLQQQHESFEYAISGRVYLENGPFSIPFKQVGVLELHSSGPSRRQGT
jgi:LEA14-like dessication related protein